MPKDYTSAVGAAPREVAERAAPALARWTALRDARRCDFDLFRDAAAVVFADPRGDDRHHRMTARSGFAVSEARFDGRRALQVAYGARTEPRALPEDAYPGARPQTAFRQEIEKGAALVYAQGLDGAVSAYLYPARSESLAPEEDGFLLGRWTDLSGLTGVGALQDHWALLRAYAEVTASDGEPRLADHARVAWLRFSRKALKNGRLHVARASNFIEIIGAFAISVGVAALMLA